MKDKAQNMEQPVNRVGERRWVRFVEVLADGDTRKVNAPARTVVLGQGTWIKAKEGSGRYYTKAQNDVVKVEIRTTDGETLYGFDGAVQEDVVEQGMYALEVKDVCGERALSDAGAKLAQRLGDVLVSMADLGLEDEAGDMLNTLPEALRDEAIEYAAGTELTKMQLRNEIKKQIEIRDRKRRLARRYGERTGGMGYTLEANAAQRRMEFAQNKLDRL